MIEPLEQIYMAIIIAPNSGSIIGYNQDYLDQIERNQYVNNEESTYLLYELVALKQFLWKIRYRLANGRNTGLIQLNTNDQDLVDLINWEEKKTYIAGLSNWHESIISQIREYNVEAKLIDDIDYTNLYRQAQL